MKRSLKIIGAVFAGCGLLAVAAVVAVRVFLPPEKLKEMAVAEAAKTLHRQLEVKSVDFSLLNGLRISGLRLSERPDFSKGEFLKAASFTLKPEWMPLLHKKIVARTIALESASLSVVKGKDGLFNFSDLAGGSAGGSDAAGPAAGAFAAPIALAVDSVRLSDVSLHYADRQQSSSADLKVEDLEVDGFTLSGPFSLSVSAKADYAAGGKRYAGTMKAKGTADLAGGDLAKVSLDLSKIALGSQGKEVTGSLKAEGGQALKLALELDVPALDSKFLNAALAAGVPPGLDLPPIHVQAKVSYAEPSVEVSSFKVSAAGVEVSGSAFVPDVNAKEPAIKVSASSNEFKLGPLLAIAPQGRGLDIDGKASFKFSAQGPAGNPDLPVIEAALSLDPISAAGLRKLSPAAPEGLQLPKTTAELSASVSGSSLNLKRLQVRAADLDARVSGKVAGLKTKTQTFQLKLSVAKFRLSSLAEGVADMAKLGLAGTVELLADLSGTAAAPKASGSLSVNGVGLQYQGQTLEKVTGQVLFTQDSVDMPQLTGRVNGGDFRLKVKASNFSAPTVTVSGWLSLLDLGILQKFADGPAPAPGASGGQTAPQPSSSSAPPVKTSGDITVDKTIHPNLQFGRMALAWNLSEVTPDLKRLNGTAKLSVGPGKAVSLLDYASSRGGMTKALIAPLKAVQAASRLGLLKFELPDVNNIAFNSIIGNYSASRGVISIQPFQLDGGTLLNLAAAGVADMPSDKVDLKIILKSSGIPREMGTELNMTATGPVSNPSVKLNVAQQVRSAVQENVKKEATKLLEKGAQDLLKGLFKPR